MDSGIADFTADREFHPALKIVLLKNKNHSCEHPESRSINFSVKREMLKGIFNMQIYTNLSIVKKFTNILFLMQAGPVNG